MGDSLTVADTTMFDVLNNFSFNMFPSVAESFPKLVAFKARIAAQESMAAYLAGDAYKKLAPFASREK